MADANFQPFSNRFREAIIEKRIQINLPRRVKNRLLKTLERYDSDICVTQPNGYQDYSTILYEVLNDLLESYGDEYLTVNNEKNEHVKVDTLQEFIRGCYPAQVFDVVEIVNGYLDPEEQKNFQNSINSVLRNEKVPWLFCDGYFFHIDSQFFEDFVLCHAHDLLKTNNFQGALDEFTEARNDLESGDYKDVILNSCKAFESVLKVITKKKTLTCKNLIKELPKTDFYEGLPDEIHPDVWNKIFEPVSLIRNKVAGHGQGKKITDVPETLARFVLHNAGSSIVFLVEHYLEINKTDEPEKLPENLDDELPF